MLLSALPWTVGLLTVTTLISWVARVRLGGRGRLARRRRRASRFLVPVSLLLYTTPYYILALILVFLFAFRWPTLSALRRVFGRTPPGLDVEFMLDVLHHAMLPALSILLVSLGWWFLSMRSLITSLKGEDYILNAEAMGIKKRRIMWGYAFATRCCRRRRGWPSRWAISSAAPSSPR